MGTLDLDSVMTVKRKRVVRELVQGQEAATQLMVLLQKHSEINGSLSAEELGAKILRSFAESLSVLASSEAATGGEASQDLAISGGNGSQQAASCNDLGFEDSDESWKRSSPVVKKDRRGCYKRRKNAQTWTIVSSKTNDDYAWRKYGQKEILDSKFPRSYFRCTHKHDQGCRAIKQVQRIQENPDLYQTTYIGNHTCCRDHHMVKADPQLVDIDSTAAAWESFLVNQPADPSNAPFEQAPEHPFGSSTPINVSLWSDLKDFEPAAVMLSSKMASDNNADTVYSCSGSHSNLEMDFGVDSVFGTSTDPAHFHFDI